MKFFRRRKSSKQSPPDVLTWKERLRRIVSNDSDLMAVAGPEDGNSVCTDWVGAVVSISGRSNEFPALLDAVADGLFHSTCSHTLAPYYPPEGEVEARFCSRLAVAAMNRRRDDASGKRIEDPVLIANRRDSFTRLYDAARRTESAGDLDAAFQHCLDAYGLLTGCNLFGPEQVQVERVLKARMQTIVLRQVELPKGQ